jgi:hypothetical protein
VAHNGGTVRWPLCVERFELIEKRKIMKKGIKIISVVTLIAVGVSAQAQHVGGYNSLIIKNPAQNNAAGQIKEIRTSNKRDGTDFAWYSTFSKSPDGKLPNAYWVVVSPGPNPKGHAGELGIFYVDATKGTPTVTAYAYNGKNGFTSFNDGNGNGTNDGGDRIWSSAKDKSIVKDLRFSDSGNERTIGFRIDPSKINNHKPKYPGNTPWTGAAYGDKIGIWFHPVTEATTNYDAKGYLTAFNFKQQGWYDVDNLHTYCTDTPVPEPATMAALGLGIAAMIRRRRSK